MSTNQFNTKMGLDNSQYIQAAQTQITAIGGQSAAISGLISVSENFNKLGQATSATFKAMSADGRILTGVIKDITQAQRDAAKLLQQGLPAPDLPLDLAKARLDSAKPSKGSKTPAALNPQNVASGEAAVAQLRALFPAPANATIAQMARYETQLSKVQALVTSGKVSGTRFNEILNASQNKTLGDIKLSGDETRLVGILGQISKGFQTAKDAAEQFHLGFRNLFRITEALLFKEAIAQVTGEIVRGTQEAAKYQIQISEIRTLSLDNQSSFQSWSESIARVSNLLGIDQTDVATAGYEALSAQITQTKEETEKFLKTSGELGRVAKGDIKESGDVLAGVFNAYGLSVDRAEEVSAKLFVAIDRGNFTLKDLHGNFGRITSVASALGISLDEVLAALTTITRQGTSPADAMTQLLNIMLKFQDPGEKLKGFFNNTLNVGGGQAALALKGGLLPVLKEIEKATQGDLQLLSELGGEQRAVRGLTATTTRGKSNEFGEDLKLIRDASVDRFKRASDIRGESSGDQLTKELNKVKNFFTNQFGQQTLQFINEQTKEIGGLGNAVEKVATAGTIFVKVFGTYYILTKSLTISQAVLNGVYGLFTKEVQKQTIELTKAQAAAAGLKTGLNAIVGVITFSVLIDELVKFNSELDKTNKKSEDFETVLDKIQRARKGQAANGQTLGSQVFQQNLLQQGQQFVGFVDTLFQPLLQKEADAKGAAAKVLQDLQTEGKVTAEGLKAAFESVGQSISDTVRRLAQGVNQGEKEILDAKKAILSVKETVESLIFDLKFDFASPAQKFILRDQEIQRLTEQSRKLLASENPEDIQRGRGLSQQLLQKVREDARERVQAQVDADRAARFQRNSRGGVQDVSPILAITREQEDRLRGYAAFVESLEQGVIDKKTISVALTEEERKTESARLALLQDRFKLLQQLSPTTEAGNIQKDFQDPTSGKFDPAKFDKEFQKRFNGVTSLLRTEEEKNLILADIEKVKLNLLQQQSAQVKLQTISLRQLELGKLQTGVKADFEDATKKRIEASGQVDASGRQLDASKDLIKEFLLEASSDSRLDSVGKDNNTVVRNLNRLALVFEKARDQFTRQLDLVPTDEVVSAKQTRFNKLSKNVKKIDSLLADFETGRQALTARDATGKLTGSTDTVDKFRKTAEELFLELKVFVGAFNGQFQGAGDLAPPGKASPNEIQKTVKDTVDQSIKAFQTEKEQENRQEAIIGDLRNFFDPITFANAQQAAATKALTAAMLPLTPATLGLTAAFQKLVIPPTMNVPAVIPNNGFHDGGLIKGPSGYDNLLIRAEANEFVVNSKATRQWLPQLIAMNGGLNPTRKGHYHDGGIVQTNVGDVNVTLNGPVSPQATPLVIGKAIKRHIRRGNL